MTDYLLFQEFAPEEQKMENICIWCLKKNVKNRAHIISKKLNESNQGKHILRFSVCRNCNDHCGKIEQWILRNTPLGWARFFLYRSSNRHSQASTVPSYYYDSKFKELIICKIDGSGRIIRPQLILGSGEKFAFYSHGEFGSDFDRSSLDKLVRLMKSDTSEIAIMEDLPVGFSSRALLDGDRILVIARSEVDFDLFKRVKGGFSFDGGTADLVRAESSGKEVQHYKWSRENWLKFCTKVSFETLSLFEGNRFCLKEEFQQVRSFVLSDISKNYSEIIFDEKGPVNISDNHFPACVDLSVGQNCSQTVAGLLMQVEAGMHGISLYEFKGWIFSSISISGLQPILLILGGPNLHLSDCYKLIYDDREGKFYYLKLAFDKNEEATPAAMSGEMFKELTTTCNLKSAKID